MKDDLPPLDSLFPFEYQGGGHFRKKGVPKGVNAETLHGEQAVKYLYEEILKRLSEKTEES